MYPNKSLIKKASIIIASIGSEGINKLISESKIFWLVDSGINNTKNIKTNAISNWATINAKPKLEIFADDVKCSHGCTIGQLDENALFYLQTRGIPAKEAKALLLYAFANEALESIKIPELKTKINKIIADKLGVDLGFSI